MNDTKNIVFRDFTDSDAEIIVSWLDNEREFYFWSADRYGHFPILPSEIVKNYQNCQKQTFFKPMTLEVDGSIVGHCILRTPSSDKSAFRIGFVIVDNKLRGKGYGKLLVNLAVDYAKNTLHSSRIDLGVFENNENAISCYKRLGFEFESGADSSFSCNDQTWNYKTMVYKK